jgi:hypothetical protein
MQGNFSEWLSDFFHTSRDDPVAAFVNAARGINSGLFFTITSRYPLGTNIYERDWDLLIVLDACRVDAMRTVADEFDFVDSVDSIWSVGSSSHEWLCKTFTNDHLPAIRETGYISTNPNTPPTFRDGIRPPRSYSIPFMWADWDVVDEADFKLLRQIHKHDYEDLFATVDPELVTDHAIHAGRAHDFDRLIVHYFQPHRPYIAEAFPEERPVTATEDHPWSALRDGSADRDEVWELYLDNLRLALASVQRLLANTSAEDVVITADHGDLFGELGLYGHPEGVAHPNLKKVPWVETTATDERTSTPQVDIDRQEGTTVDVEAQLDHLGYI